MESLIDLIPSLGFPIVCVIALGWFAWYMVKRSDEISARNMEQVQQDCKDREEKLYNEIKENREINGKFAEIIAKYDTKLDCIQRDVSDIKTDITSIKSKQ